MPSETEASIKSKLAVAATFLLATLAALEQEAILAGGQKKKDCWSFC